MRKTIEIECSTRDNQEDKIIEAMLEGVLVNAIALLRDSGYEPTITCVDPDQDWTDDEDQDNAA